MTRDDIIRMAREAGFAHSWSEAAGEALERFAALVAATKHEANRNEFNPDWDVMAVLVEESQRMAKRIEELELQVAQLQMGKQND